MTEKKIFSDLSQLKIVIDLWKNQGLEVVFTNGCFDVLHLGHVDYLEKAKNLGDKLVVALNTDASVKKLKGEKRPINDEYARCRVIAALGFVDAVILFNEENPLSLIEEIVPDILVKGKDYSIENIVGANVVIDNGGSVKTIDLVEGYSTTKIIEKMLNT
ncbi:MAG: D-glycero-beta-D-manno-heptose 1-phosphate adenylyltransferase [Cytophagales bacterium]